MVKFISQLKNQVISLCSLLKEKIKRASRVKSVLKVTFRVIGAGTATFAISVLQDTTFADPFTLIEFVLIIIFFNKYSFRAQKHTAIPILVFSLFLSFSLIIGKNRASGTLFGNYTNSIPHSLRWLTLFAMFIGICLLLYLLLLQICKYYQHQNQHNERVRKHHKAVFFVTFFIIIAFWIPFLLRYWPGALTSDSLSQVYQALGITNPSDHHPYAHTLIIKLFYTLGNIIFGSSNAGVATYSIFQMVTMASIFSYLLCLLYKSNLKMIYICCFTAFFAIMPINAVYSFTMWKNIPFSGAVLLLSISIWQLIVRQKEKRSIIRMLLLFVFSAVAVSALQSNGIFVTLACVPIILFILRKRIIIAFIISLVPILAFILIKGPLWNSLKVEKGDMVESLSIPVQQIARVISDNEPLSQDEISLIEDIVPIDEIREQYLSYKSDPIKVLVRKYNGNDKISENSGAYIHLWFQLGLEHPKSYIKAFLDQTYGYWYPNINYWVLDTGIISNEIGLMQTPKIQGRLSSMIDFYVRSKNYPVWGLLWSSGAYVLAMFLFGVICMVKRQNRLLLVFLPCLVVWLTLLLATPVYAEFRYIYCIVITIPLFIALPLLHNKEMQDGLIEKNK